MRYRDAKKLHNGDQVTRKFDQQTLTVSNVEVFGQYKRVKIVCLEGGTLVELFHDEVE